MMRVPDWRSASTVPHFTPFTSATRPLHRPINHLQEELLRRPSGRHEEDLRVDVTLTSYTRGFRRGILCTPDSYLPWKGTKMALKKRTYAETIGLNLTLTLIPTTNLSFLV